MPSSHALLRQWRVILIALTSTVYLSAHGQLLATEYVIGPPSQGGSDWDAEAEIQGALDRASDGDIITLFPGHYEANLIFPPKDIVLRGHPANLPEEIVIDGADCKSPSQCSVIDFEWSVSSDKHAQIQNLTLTGGLGHSRHRGGYDFEIWEKTYGGAIYASSASVDLVDVRLVQNQAKYGGGLYLTNSDVSMVRVVIEGNEGAYVGGIDGYNSAITMSNCLLLNNVSYTVGGGYFEGGTTVISQSVVYGNVSNGIDEPGGLKLHCNSCTLHNNILTENVGADDRANLHSIPKLNAGYVNLAYHTATGLSGVLAPPPESDEEWMFVVQPAHFVSTDLISNSAFRLRAPQDNVIDSGTSDQCLDGSLMSFRSGEDAPDRCLDPDGSTPDLGAFGGAGLDLDEDGFLVGEWWPIGEDEAPEVLTGYDFGNLDCDDLESSTFPDAPPVCNGNDSDCDGDAEEGFDQDKDGYVNGADDSCVANVHAPELDCDDLNPEIYPGADETPYDGVDSDCDGEDLNDLDSDGHVGGPNGADCDDLNPDIFPGNLELCQDDIDSNCNGLLSEGCPCEGTVRFGRCMESRDGCGGTSAEFPFFFWLSPLLWGTGGYRRSRLKSRKTADSQRVSQPWHWRSLRRVLRLILLCCFLNTSLSFVAMAQVPASTSTGSSQASITPVRHVLIVANDEYQSDWTSLPGVLQDVAAYKQLFQELGYSVKVARNLTREGMVRELDAFKVDYGLEPSNQLILIYAGHGHSMSPSPDRPPQAYLVPVDAPQPPRGTSPNKAFLAKAYPMTNFLSLATEFSSNQMLFIFDSCFAGEIFSLDKSSPPNPTLDRPVRYVITAGAADEVVPDKSIFAEYLVEGLREHAADRDKNGYVTAFELGVYLQYEVSGDPRAFQRPQHGRIRWGDFVGTDYLIFEYEAEACVPAAVSSPGLAERCIADMERSLEHIESLGRSFNDTKWMADALLNFERRYETIRLPYREYESLLALAHRRRKILRDGMLGFRFLEVSPSGLQWGETEVTVAQYGACVSAGRCTNPLSHRERRGCNWQALGREEHPINCVDLTQANAFAEWAEARLPDVSEWQIIGVDAHQSACPGAHLWEPSYGFSQGWGCGTGGTKEATCPPLQSYPCNVVGNVWEWTADGLIVGGGWDTMPTVKPAQLVRELNRSEALETVGIRLVRSNDEGF